MRKFVLAGNWKMNMTLAQLESFFKEFTTAVESVSKDVWETVDVCFAVPFLQLQRASELTKDLPIRIAAQNIHFEKSGAFTGEISASMLNEISISTALIGHSERRQYFGETNETVCKKVAACLASNILPVICIGESKDERESGAFFDVIKEQLEAFYPSVINLNDVIVAYEPVWAIGTGLTASDEQAQQVHAFIRKELSVKYGEDQASKVRLLYGGSAKPANIDGLLEQADIDGGLVGGASLKAADFSSMVTKAFKKAKS